MIPKNLEKEHFILAVNQIDKDGFPTKRESVNYDIIINDKPYPPKYLISLATKFATGEEFPPSEFNAVEAKNYFINRGYIIKDRRTPDRNSFEQTMQIINKLLPDQEIRNTVFKALACYWQYAKRLFPNKTFITLASNYIRMNVGRVEVFVIKKDHILLVVDKQMTFPNSGTTYKSHEDALPLGIQIEEFEEENNELSPAVFSVINKLGLTQKHPTACKGHSPALAELLESEFLDNSLLDYPDESKNMFHEGSKKEIIINTYERDPAARRACLKFYDSYKCQICGFDFEEVYGTIGKETIHVHHLEQISDIGKIGGKETDPTKDLIPVCPNCHVMLHSKKPQPLTPEELREIIMDIKKLS